MIDVNLSKGIGTGTKTMERDPKREFYNFLGGRFFHFWLHYTTLCSYQYFLSFIFLSNLRFITFRISFYHLVLFLYYLLNFPFSISFKFFETVTFLVLFILFCEYCCFPLSLFCYVWFCGWFRLITFRS